jgi:hypothetical protein
MNVVDKGMEIDGLDEIEVENTAVESLVVNDVTIMLLEIDSSGSMDDYTGVMKLELENFKNAVAGSPEKDRILVARADFSDFVNVEGYKKIGDFKTEFVPSARTRLYDAIVDGGNKLIQYVDYLSLNGVRVKAVLAVFSDGLDNLSQNTLRGAAGVVKSLKEREVVTVFVSFGESTGVAKNLGFKNVLGLGRSNDELKRAFNVLGQGIVAQSAAPRPKVDDFLDQ